MSSETVKVIVRLRPLNERENNLRCKSVIGIETNRGQCSIQNPSDYKTPPKTFFFDGAYGIDSTTEQLYSDIVYPLVEGVTEGYNGTIFAYGQTGCGKSFTMQGISDPATQRGVIPRSFDHIFETISVSEGTKYLVHASYLEIYNEEIRDLLAKDTKAKLELKERPDKGVYVAGLSMHKVSNVNECQVIMERGWKNRATGATLMNVDSSRSHSIFTIYLEMINADEEGEEHIRSGKLNLVDLAGSERQSKTGSTGDRLKEATKINLSLSALGNVISALVDGKSKHIPYRDSKLTRMLQDSLGGNTKTLMIACLSPADNNHDESLSTLRYANRAKNIQNKPKINEDPKDALLRQFQEEIAQLKLMLSGKIPTNLNINHDNNSLNSEEKQYILDAEREKIKAEYEAKLAEKEAQYNAEAADKAKLRKEMEKLKLFYDSRLNELDIEHLPLSNEVLGMMDNNLPSVTFNVSGPESLGHIERSLGTPDIFKGNISDSSVMVVNPDGQLQAVQPQKAIHVKSTPGPQGKQNDHTELLNKLRALQSSIVGGEQASNEVAKDRHSKRKNHAENKKRLLMELNEKMEDDGIMLGVFEDIQDELKAKSRQLKKEKEKNGNLMQDISDLQEEFQKERCDYLESIRKLDQEKELLKCILDKVQSCIRRGCNYSNIDKIKSMSKFDEDTGKWVLPPLKMEQTQLPMTTDDNNQFQRDIDDENLYRKLSNRVDPSQEYFHSKKSSLLLSQRHSPNVSASSGASVNNSSLQRVADYGAYSSGLRAAEVHGLRNVHRLDAISATKKSRKKTRYIDDHSENDF